MKKITIIYMLMMAMFSLSVFGATPSCGDYINTNIVFDSNLNCTTGGSTLYFNSSNLLVDCNGYSIYQNTQYTPIFKATMDLNNVTVQNCNFYSDVVFYDYNGYDFVNFNWFDNYWEYIGTSDWTTFLDFNGGMWWNDSIVSGNNILLNTTPAQGVYIMYIYETSNLTIENNIINADLDDPLFWIVCDWAQEVVIKNNDISNVGDDMIFRIYDNPCDKDIQIYNNNLSWVQNTRVSNVFNVTDYVTYGNYYGACNDTSPVDGICDDPFNSQNWWDYGALSSPAPAPCTPSWSCNSYTCNGTTGVKSCNAVIDANICNESYTGNYSEYLTTCPTYNSGDFDEGSTDLDEVDDYTNVSYLTLSNSGNRIQWQNNVNINGSNLSATIVIRDGFVSVDGDNLDSSLNTPADVDISTSGTQATCGSFELYYSNLYYTSLSDIIGNGQIIATEGSLGSDCTDSSICQNVVCINGVVSFEAQHFDSFAMQQNTAAREGCHGIQLTVYAGLGLLAVAIIALSAFAIIQIVGGDVTASMLISIAIGVIGLAVVLMIGYIIISAAGTAIC